ncbi:hypothetical protein WJX75_008527 [Coccomyxa subellipsoidea]|uniref:BZIP domain-containing protein n=1 Tax=Coccomyxa subellipsoidea TaxID=248742 RepID=A0ABR2YN83_9CHLO
MTDARERGKRQKAFRLRQKERHQASERQLQELSDRVIALEHEREQLQRAVETATTDSQGIQPGSCGLDNDEIAAAFCLGEATVQMHLTKGEVRTLTVYAMADIWKTLVHKMGLSLDKVDAAPRNSRFRQRLKEIVHEALSFLWTLVLFNPNMLSLINTCNMEAPTESQCSTDEARDWPAILDCMQPTKKQAEQLMACRRMMLREVGALIAEWDRLWGELESIRDMEEKTQRAVINHVHSASLAERLRLNVRSLHTCRAYYQSYACNKVLSPVQTARYLVASYPMGPDTLSLMTCLAQQRGEPSTSELLQTARPRTAAAAYETRPHLCKALG